MILSLFAIRVTVTISIYRIIYLLEIIITKQQILDYIL